MVLVICCCLLLVGIISSTPSTHGADHSDACQRPAHGRARRSGRRSKVDPAVDIGGSYSRYSSELQDESSIGQQQKRCRDRAAEDRVTIVGEFEFADEAVSGTKRDRAGLNSVLAAAAAGQFRTVYFDSISRLARESVITMPLLKRLVYVDRVRVVSVTEGIDSSHGNWDLIANFMSWFAEQFLKALRDAVLRGQEHAILNDWSAGDWCFGYTSEIIPGSEIGRRGRDPKPRKRVVLLRVEAEWVRQIFRWGCPVAWPTDVPVGHAAFSDKSQRETNMSTTMTNGKPRRQLSDQIDRLEEQLVRQDAVIDALSEGLNQAVADAAREGVKEAVQAAVIELLTNVELRPALHRATASDRAARPSAWARLKAFGRRVVVRGRAAAAAVGRAVMVRAVAMKAAAVAVAGPATVALKFRKAVLAGLAVGAVVAVGCYAASHGVAAVVSGVGAAVMTVAVQVGLFVRKAVRRLATV